MMNIYVGNISYQSTEESLQELFEQYGEVSSVKLITDRETGRKRGFGFIEMATEEGGAAAIEKLNDFVFDGRNLRVNEAKKREQRGPREY